MDIGFVVNIENTLNFNIDINDKKYVELVKNNSYTYEEKGERKNGISYACRIKGVKSKNRKGDKKKFYNEKPTLYNVKAKIEQYNGWVNILPHNIDKYCRLIVSIYTPENENLSDIILKDEKNFTKIDV